MRKKPKISTIFIWATRIVIFLMLTVCVAGLLGKSSLMGDKSKFNFVQAIMFFALTFIPDILKLFKITLPEGFVLMAIGFGFAHFFCGEIFNFYATVWWWDSMLHSFSGVIIAVIAFSFINLLNNCSKDWFKDNVFLVCMISFCLTVTVGVIWEVFEFSVDGLLGGNMQRAINSITGEPFIGRRALMDTMKDLILDMCGALVGCVICGVQINKKGCLPNGILITSSSPRRRVNIEDQPMQIDEEE